VPSPLHRAGGLSIRPTPRADPFRPPSRPHRCRESICYCFCVCGRRGGWSGVISRGGWANGRGGVAGAGGAAAAGTATADVDADADGAAAAIAVGGGSSSDGGGSGGRARASKPRLRFSGRQRGDQGE